MKTLSTTLTLISIILLMGFAPKGPQPITFNHIENVNEMESAPEELYIVINNIKYLVNTKTNTSTIIQTY